MCGGEGKISTVLQELITLCLCALSNLTERNIGGRENIPMVRAGVS